MFMVLGIYNFDRDMKFTEPYLLHIITLLRLIQILLTFFYFFQVRQKAKNLWKIDSFEGNDMEIMHFRTIGGPKKSKSMLEKVSKKQFPGGLFSPTPN